MAGIAKFAIMFTANASGVEQGVNRAEKSLRGLSGAAASSNTAMGSLGGGIAKVGASIAGLAAGAITVQKLGSFVLSAVDRIDQLGDRADALDETADNLNALDYAAVRMGSSGEAVASSLNKMVKSLGEAEMNGGPAAEAIEKLGLNLDELTKMSPTEALVEISSALAEIPNTYERASVASKIFGRGSAELGAVLKMSGEDLEKYMSRYRELNGTLTDDSVKAASVAQDAIDDIGVAFDGLGNVVIGAAGPQIKGMADDISKMVSNLSNSQEFATKIDSTFVGMRLTLGLVLDIIGPISRGMQIIAGASKVILSLSSIGDTLGFLSGNRKAFKDSLFTEGLNDILGKAEEVSKKVEVIGKTTVETKKTVADAANGMNGAIGSVGDTANETSEDIKGIGVAAEESAAKLQTAGEKMRDTAMIGQGAANGGLSSFWSALNDYFVGDGSLHKETTDALGDFFSGVSKSIQDFGDSLTEEMRTPMEKFEDRMNDINDAFDRGTISVETYNRASKKAFDDMQTASGIDVIGGDQPGMMGGGIDPALQRMIDFSMPNAGFAGDGSMPANWRLFAPPGDDTSRNGMFASDVLDSAGVPYFDQQMGEDPQLADANRYLQQIAQNTAMPQAVS